MSHGGTAPDPDPVERVEVITSLPEIQRGDEGDAVSIWQVIAGVQVDGDFGPATQAATIKWQAENGLKADGIVGAKTWAEGLKSIN